MEKYGFVYIWRDRKHKRHYIGSHWGTEIDGYLCSSNWMRDAYKRRPEDFKRRIIARGYLDRASLYLEEERWLSMIKPEEIRKRYYNLSLGSTKHWTATDNRGSVGEKISLKAKKRCEDLEYRRRMSQAALKHFEEHPEACKKTSLIVKQHYRENPERGKNHGRKMRGYYEEHPESRDEMAKVKLKYYEEHPESKEVIGEGVKKYYESHPGEMSHRKSKYYEEHPEAKERIRQTLLNYHKEHPEALKKARQARRSNSNENLIKTCF